MATGKDRKYKRILLKLSGEELMGQEGFGIDPKVLDKMALEIGQLVGIGVQVGLVVGGGNLFRGAALSAVGLDRVTGDKTGTAGDEIIHLHLSVLSTLMGRIGLDPTASARERICSTFGGVVAKGEGLLRLPSDGRYSNA